MKHIKNIEQFIEWLKTCPVQHRYKISSVQSDIVHATFDLSEPATDPDDHEQHNQRLREVERGQ